MASAERTLVPVQGSLVLPSPAPLCLSAKAPSLLMSCSVLAGRPACSSPALVLSLVSHVGAESHSSCKWTPSLSLSRGTLVALVNRWSNLERIDILETSGLLNLHLLFRLSLFSSFLYGRFQSQENRKMDNEPQAPTVAPAGASLGHCWPEWGCRGVPSH